MQKRLIECVPNFSEGRDLQIIDRIVAAIKTVEGVQVLNIDPGKATNRTVVTFVGTPEAVVEGAFQGIKTAAALIDMSKHSGEHPRMGATDVCPLIPIAGVTMDEAVAFAKQLAQRVGEELSIPVYLYEAAASKPEWRNLATIRAGEYEALPEKMTKPEWKPDFGEQKFNATAGATVIGARDFLIAYNVNLNTTSVRRANSVAFDIREKGRIKREGDPITGKIVTDENGNPVREAGLCKGVKAIGWFIEEYGVAQISMNITDTQQTPVHVAFEACRKSANARGMRVTGSELVGMAPLQVFLDAGRYYLEQQQRSVGVSEEELIKIAVKSMGMDDLTPFDAKEKIIEYSLKSAADTPLLNMNLEAFANETASESMAPGGGSISAYVGALGVSLGTMVANLSSHKRGWDDRWQVFSAAAAEGQALKSQLLAMVDEDTHAFNGIIAAMRLPKGTDTEKATRTAAIQAATKYATEVPFRVMQLAANTFDLLKAMAENGNPNSITDVGVGVLCARAAVRGAFLNVKINAAGLKDKAFVAQILADGEAIATQAAAAEANIMEMVEAKIKG